MGQYQHDVSQTHLARALDAVVEDCVNAVGLRSIPLRLSLLARVAGLNNTIANNIVAFRNERGPLKPPTIIKSAAFGRESF